MNFLSLGFGTATIAALITAAVIEGELLTAVFFSIAVVLAYCTALFSRFQ